MTPVARAWWPASTTAEERQTVRFTSLSINNPTRLTWDFGDGSTDSGSSVTPPSTRAGRYTVTLRASNAAGEGVDHDDHGHRRRRARAGGGIRHRPRVVRSPRVRRCSSPTSRPAARPPRGHGTSATTRGAARERNPTHVFSTKAPTPSGSSSRTAAAETTSRGRSWCGRRSRSPTSPSRRRCPTPDRSCSSPNGSRNVTPGTTWAWNFGDGATSSERCPRHAFTARDYLHGHAHGGERRWIGHHHEDRPGQPRRLRPRTSATRRPTTSTPPTLSSSRSARRTTPATPRRSSGTSATAPPATASATRSTRSPGPATSRSRSRSTNVVGTSTSPAQTVRVTVPAPTAAFTVPATPRIAGTPITFTNTSAGWSVRHRHLGVGRRHAQRQRQHPLAHLHPGRHLSGALTVRTRVAATRSARTSACGRSSTPTSRPRPRRSSGQTITFANHRPAPTRYTSGLQRQHLLHRHEPEPLVHRTPRTRAVTVRRALTARERRWQRGDGDEERVVDPAAPVADFTYAPGGRGVVNFTTARRTGAPVSYVWNFGDGSATDTSGPTVGHAYSGDGPYSVTLTVTNPTGSDPPRSASRWPPRPSTSRCRSASPNVGQNLTFDQHVHRRAVLVGDMVVGRRHRERHRADPPPTGSPPPAATT